MNINCKVSHMLYRYERHYHKENILDSKYLIIKRECQNAPLGLFAYYITNVAWIEYALRKNYIPVIDMKNFYNTFHNEGEVGQINTWEYFFEQPLGISIEEALQTGKARYVWDDIPAFHPNESLDFFQYTELVDYYKEIARKYIPFKREIKEILEKEKNELLKNFRVLGVLARGTDYTNLKPYFQPVQPTIEELIDKVDDYRKKYNCEKIFLATEDNTILEQMQERYKDDLLFVNQKRISHTDTYLNMNAEFMDVDTAKRGIDYLKAIYCLSKCEGLVAGRTSGTVGAVLLSDNYSFQYIFSKGRYGVEENIMRNRIPKELKR